MQKELEQKYAANVLMSLLKDEEGENTIILDQEDAQNLYRICVMAVQNTDEKLNKPLYKGLLAGYLLKQRKAGSEEHQDNDDEEEQDEESEDGNNNEEKDNDEDPEGDEGNSKKSPEGETDDEDDDDEPPPEKYVRQERRIKRRNDKPKGDSGKKRHSLVVKNSPSLQDDLTANDEHQEFLNIGARVKMLHEMHKWKVTAIKQIAHKWLLIARVKRYARALKTRVHLNARKERK